VNLPSLELLLSSVLSFATESADTANRQWLADRSFRFLLGDLCVLKIRSTGLWRKQEKKIP
jgi:hypothetical protein